MIKDPYVQENGTLKNRLGITDYNTLNSAEKDITFSKFLNIKETLRTKFDISYIKAIHKHIFEDIFAEYTSISSLEQVKTTNLGSMYELKYHITLKDAKKEKEMIDQLRCRNGNLTIICGKRSTLQEEL